MKKLLVSLFILIVAVLSFAFYLEGKNISNVEIAERPIRYYKDIDVVVVSNKTETRFAKTRWYFQTLTVKSEEYGIEETFKIKESGMFANIPYWNVKEGDTLQATMYSWVIESTGEVTSRQIARLN